MQTDPLLAIVVDDVTSNDEIGGFLQQGIPLSFAFLPHADPATVAMAVSARCSVLLHAPMEAFRLDAGDASLRCGMDCGEISAVLDSWLSGIPQAIGVSNHMGSKATSDRSLMHVVLSLLAERGLLFLDSRTAASSVGSEVAEMIGTRFLQRDVFLDPDGKVETSMCRLHQLADTAKRRGYAIGVCHVRRNTPALLTTLVPNLLQQGCLFGTLADVIDHIDANHAGA